MTISKGVVKRLQVIQNHFLWGDTGESRKYHLVARNELKKPMHVGGFGLHSLIEMNEKLQGKWL